MVEITIFLFNSNRVQHGFYLPNCTAGSKPAYKLCLLFVINIYEKYNIFQTPMWLLRWGKKVWINSRRICFFDPKIDMQPIKLNAELKKTFEITGLDKKL